MGERDRNQYSRDYYRDRNEGRNRESSPYRQGERSDWDRDVDYSPWRVESETERDDRGYGEYSQRNYGERGYGQREYGQREYGQRNYGERQQGREQRMFDPYGTRSLGYDSQRFPGTFGSYEDQVAARDAARRSGSSSNYDYRTRDLYRPTWGEDYDYDYRGRERGRGEHHGFGQQLRDAGQRVVRSVKRAFRGTKGYKRSDERIREDVNDRLSLQDHLDPTEIEVTVSNSEVTLTGSVISRHEKFIAEEIADDVGGVTEVHNQLRVRREGVQTAPASSEATSLAGAQAVTDAARNRNARA